MRREGRIRLQGVLWSPERRCGVGASLAYLEDAVGALDLVPGAPANDKGAGERNVIEIDCDRVVQHTVQAGPARKGPFSS
jgi:hypothetical protein